MNCSRSTLRVPRTPALAACIAVLLAAIVAAPASAAREHGTRIGSAAPLPAASSPLGLLPAATRLHVTVTLKPRDPAALAAFATAVSTPGSPLYRHYISPAQFAARFGPAPAQIAAVRASLRAHGLDPATPTANGLAIPVAATAGAVSHALSISFARISESGRRVGFASTAAPLFDTRVAGIVQGVVGLDSVAGPEPLALRPLGHHAVARTVRHVVTGGPQPCAAATTAAPSQSALTADQIASAYRFSGLYQSGDLGAGQTIAIYELESDDPNDIAAYQACYGTSASVQYIGVDGGSGGGAGTGEAALDIEDVIGLAPKANILVYQGPNSNSGAPGAGPYDTYNAIISQDRAKVISTSWGQCESLEGQADAVAEGTLFQEAAAQGQTIVSASGDQGSEDCFAPGQNLSLGAAVDDPSSQPYVTGVGGTSIGSLGPPPSETVWNNGSGLSGLLGASAGAGGGGISSLWRMPLYQSSAPSSLHVINSLSSSAQCGATGADCREVPDVSADADPFTGYLVYYQGGWTGIGGTSAAAPVWAALIALADASPQCNGTTVGFANPALYRAAGSAYSQYFDDVTSGNNDFTGTDGGNFAAGAGYDMASGLGTPIASALAVALCETVTVENPGPQRSVVGRRVSLPVSATDAGHAALSFHASGLPAGLAIDSATGRISGKPMRAGIFTVTVVAADAGGRAASVSFRWTIGYPTVISISPPVRACSARAPRACSYVAPRTQTLAAARGRPARVTVYLLTAAGTPIRGASVTVTDRGRTTRARTGSSGRATLTLRPGPNRSVRATYAGGSSFGPASVIFRVRNHG
jgi:subtilase family serine protease